MIFAQNHDQMGNRPDGARLSTLVPRRLRLAAALLLLSPGLPLLFMGEEYGEVAPFAYFVDHGDPELLDAVRRGQGSRACARCRADRSRTRPIRPPSPRPCSTASTAPRPMHAELWQLYRDLIALLRASEPALRQFLS